MFISAENEITQTISNSAKNRLVCREFHNCWNKEMVSKIFPVDFMLRYCLVEIQNNTAVFRYENLWLCFYSSRRETR